MKILVITNLYPSSREPDRGTFNRQQIRELARRCAVKVVAPVPWAPAWGKKRYPGSFVPARETIDGMDVFHPRYLVIPKVGRAWYGLLFFLSLALTIRAIRKTYPFDLLFATWAYPDGVGSYLIARLLGVPIVIKAHGSDINLYTRHFLRRGMIAFALKKAQGVIAVSRALKARMVEIGVPAAAVTVVGNGIDTTRFHPFVRRRGEQGKTVLFAGNLVPVKGVEHLIAAFAAVVRRTGSARLIIVGSGRLEEALRRQARELGIAESVVFAGRQPHDAMPAWLVRADVFCLPSLNEGCPNVVLEALACGTPVVASRVGGIGDLITCDDQGFLVPPGNVSLLADALCRALGRRWDPRRVRAATTVMSWAQSAQQVCAVLRWAQGCAPVAPAGTAGDECAPAQGAVSR